MRLVSLFSPDFKSKKRSAQSPRCSGNDFLALIQASETKQMGLFHSFLLLFFSCFLFLAAVSQKGLLSLLSSSVQNRPSTVEMVMLE